MAKLSKPSGNFCGRWTLGALVPLLVCSPLAAAGAPFVVKDINGTGASAPTELVTMGVVTYFAADNGVNGVELWKSDGSTGGTMLVKDICPGACSAAPYELTIATVPAGERIFFAADNGSAGHELWMSDGTVGGTQLVKDIEPGSGSSGVDQLVAAGNQLFFRAFDPALGLELWKSDGTAGGTQLVKDIADGGAHSTPSSLAAVGSTVYFSALGALGRELWKSDGTAPGTVVVKDINPGGQSSSPSRLKAVGSTLFFIAYSSSGYELWKSNGTSGGTALVRNINPGFASSNPDHLTALGSSLYFVANDGSTGLELWKSDGTFAGTVRVKDIFPGSASSGASQLTAVNSVLFLCADDGLVGRELWRSDGTGAGTFLVHDINTGAADSSPSQLKSVDDMLYFVADDGLSGNELWTSDGTVAGTSLVDDLLLGPVGSSPSEPTPTPSLLLFAADDGQIGRELWALQNGGPILSLTNTFAGDSVSIGTSGHTFTLTVTNNGGAPATSVRVTDSVNSRLTVTGVSPGAECSSPGQFVDCIFPTLNPGASEQIVVTYSVDSGVTPVLDVLNTAQAGDGLQLVDASDDIDLLAACAPPKEVHLNITGEDIVSTGYLAEACNSISVGPTVSVMANADATLRAGQAVIFYSGFAVESNGELTVVLDPLQSPE